MSPSPPSPAHWSDWFAAATRGDRLAQNEILRQSLPTLHAFVRLRMGPRLRAREASSDLVQNVCMGLQKDWPRLAGLSPSRFRQHLLTRAEHTIRDQARYHQRQKRTEPNPATKDWESLMRQYQSFSTPSQKLSAKEQLDKVESAFGRLPEDYQRVILLCRIGGLSGAQAGAELGRSTPATWTLLSRALGRLATLLHEAP